MYLFDNVPMNLSYGTYVCMYPLTSQKAFLALESAGEKYDHTKNDTRSHKLPRQRAKILSKEALYTTKTCLIGSSAVEGTAHKVKSREQSHCQHANARSKTEP